MILVREGNREDFRVYIDGRDFPPEWCIDDPHGLVALDDDGRFLAVAMVTTDAQDRAWIWFDQKLRLSPVVLHRQAISLLENLRFLRREIYTFVNPKEPGAEKWLRRLGFVPDRLMLHPTGEKRLAWVRK